MNAPSLIIGTVIILIFSWMLSIRHKRLHGIPRFFSFVSIYLMVLLNMKVWFHDPFSLHQIVSWILLIFSAYFGLAGFFLLKRRGKPSENFENTTILVKTGVYSLIRHPLYFSLFLLGTGIMMKDITPLTILLGAINLTAVWFTALMEEKEMIEKFGEPYKEYMKETKMFIPFFI
jgi:protein-S-isoprenylcysteine O-methyltransferase Ste14